MKFLIKPYCKTQFWQSVSVCLLAWLMNIGFVLGQTSNVKKQDVKLFDDPRIIQWSADFHAGKRAQVLASVEADLKSSSPHPFSPHVWVKLQNYLTGKALTLANLKDEKLKIALGVLPEVMRLYGDGEYRELLKRFPSTRSDEISDAWALQYLFSAAVKECRYDEAFVYVTRLARVQPDNFLVGEAISRALIDVERLRPKIAALFGKDSVYGRTDLGRFIQLRLNKPLAYASKDEGERRQATEEELVMLGAWLKEFPLNIVALEKKANKLTGVDERAERLAAYTQADTVYPFFGDNYLWAAAVLIMESKRDQAEALLKQRAALRTKDTQAAMNLAEELTAEALILVERNEEAKKLLDAALLRRPNEAALYSLRAQVEADSGGSKEKLLKYARRAWELMPNNLYYFWSLMKYLINHGEHAEAQKLFAAGEKRYTQKSPEFWEAGVLAWLGPEKEIKKEVWEVLRRGEKEYPESMELLYLEAQLLNYSGRRTEARAKLKQVFTILPPYYESIERMRVMQIDMTAEEWEEESRALLKRYPFAREFEKYIRKLELYVQTGDFQYVLSVAVSPDGKMLASGDSKSDVKLWDIETGQELKTLPHGNYHEVTSVAFSPDRTLLASSDSLGYIKLWDIATGQEIHTINAHRNRADSVAFSPDGKLLVSSGGKDESQALKSAGVISEELPVVKLWDTATGALLQTFKGQTSQITSTAFSPDRKTLASCDGDNTKLWEAATGKELGMVENLGWSIAFSSDGQVLAGGTVKTLANGSRDYTIKLWDMRRGLELRTMSGGHKDYVTSVAFSPDGKTLASGSLDNTIKLWDVATGRELRQLAAHKNHVSSVAFSLDGKTLASGSYDSTIKLWDVTTGRELKTMNRHASGGYLVAFSPDGKTLVSGSTGYTIRLWDMASMQEPKILRGHTDRIEGVAYSADGKMLASASGDKTIKVWDIVTGKEIHTLHGHKGEVNWVEFSPDGKLLVSKSSDKVDNTSKNTIKVWELGTGKELWGITWEGLFADFSQDGKTLALYGNFQDVLLRDARTGKSLGNLQGHLSEVTSIAFSPDGKMMASGSVNSTVKLWDVASRQVRKTVSGHKEDYKLVFSPDGKTLASRLRGRELIKLWDVASGKELTADVPPVWVFIRVPRWTDTYTSFTHLDGTLIRAKVGDLGLEFIDEDAKRTVATLIALDEKDWVVIDPEGRFDASPGGEKLMHYTYGLEVINLEQLKEMYYEPGLLPKLLGLNKEPLRPIVALKEIKLHPEIVSQTVGPNATTLTVKLKNLGGGIGETKVLVNGKLVVADARDAKLKANPNIPIGETVTLMVDLRGASILKGKENKITVIASNYLKEIGKGNIQSRGAEVLYLDKSKAEETMPSVYAVVGGVSDYEGERIDLHFAAKDAEDFSNALSLGARRLFCAKENPNCLDKVQIKTLSTSRLNADEQPTKENFKKAFAEIAKKAKAEDIIVIYLAGHGVTLGEGTDTYFYLTKEARSAGVDDLAKVYQTTAISNQELTDWLTPNKDNPNDIFVKARKQVLILDTCAAGNFAENKNWKTDRQLSGDQIRAMEFLKDNTGTFVLMGSAVNQPSYEASKYNQGLLTYALLEGIKGSALQPATSNIDVRILLGYAERRVPELAKDMSIEQKPIIKQPPGNSFVIGQMTDEEKRQISLPSTKPMLLRPLLTTPETGDDDLKLIPELRKRLDAESSYEVMRRSGKGDPILIYIDDDSFPGAIRLTGTYINEGNKLRVKTFLRRDGKTIAVLPDMLTTREKLMDELLNAMRLELGKL